MFMHPPQESFEKMSKWPLISIPTIHIVLSRFVIHPKIYKEKAHNIVSSASESYVDRNQPLELLSKTCIVQRKFSNQTCCMRANHNLFSYIQSLLFIVCSPIRSTTWCSLYNCLQHQVILACNRVLVVVVCSLEKSYFDTFIC